MFYHRRAVWWLYVCLPTNKAKVVIIEKKGKNINITCPVF